MSETLNKSSEPMKKEESVASIIDNKTKTEKKTCTFIKPRKIGKKRNMRKKLITDDDEKDDTEVVISKPKKKENPNIVSTRIIRKKYEEDKILSKRIIDNDDDQFATRQRDYDGDVKQTSSNPHMTGIGPIKSNTTINMGGAIDYQPDLCKDYYETGYCGYGDNCKFAHIREDYKSGWEIEREWQEQERKRRLGIQDSDSESEEEDGLPFACFFCREPFNDPIVTKCKHYFCYKCALDHYNSGDTTCAICGQQTHGIFNTAHEIIKRMKDGTLMKKKKNESDDDDE